MPMIHGHVFFRFFTQGFLFRLLLFLFVSSASLYMLLLLCWCWCWCCWCCWCWCWCWCCRCRCCYCRCLAAAAAAAAAATMPLPLHLLCLPAFYTAVVGSSLMAAPLCNTPCPIYQALVCKIFRFALPPPTSRADLEPPKGLGWG